MASLSEQLVQTLNGINESNFVGDASSRQKLATAARRLSHELETTAEKTLRLTMEEPAVFSAIQVLVAMGVWAAWAAAGGGDKTVKELAEIAGEDVEPELLYHFLRLLAANHIIKETAENRYSPSEFSLAIGDRGGLVKHALEIRPDHIEPSCRHLAEFLAKTNYRNPVDYNNSCYIDAFPEKQDFWQRCKDNPAHQQSFFSLMVLWGTQKIPWPEYYDTQALLDGAKLGEGSAFIVDVGGNRGVDLLRVLDKHPNLPDNCLVLEDRPEVTSTVKLTTNKIQVLAHDFFQPQPVKDSRAYFMHAVLHDWPDHQALEILKNIAAVMQPGYSKLLIADIVLPATGTSSYQATLDVFMMQTSAHERSEAMWKTLLNDAGLKVVKIWPDGRQNESIIEAELLYSD